MMSTRSEILAAEREALASALLRWLERDLSSETEIDTPEFAVSVPVTTKYRTTVLVQVMDADEHAVQFVEDSIDAYQRVFPRLHGDFFEIRVENVHSHGFGHL